MAKQSRLYANTFLTWLQMSRTVSLLSPRWTICVRPVSSQWTEYLAGSSLTFNIQFRSLFGTRMDTNLNVISSKVESGRQ